ncbi:MAG: polyprenyl synthetase family protein [archaeon]|nr:polyprenyl synthetase family protein [archaeon]
MAGMWYSTITKELNELESRILNVIHSENSELDEMCKYVITAGGKRFRPAVCILSYLACGGQDVRRAIDLGAAYEIVHSASLIHDDINDKSEIRRGRRTLHKEYTVSKAIVAGDYMMARGFQLLGVTSKEIVDIIVEAASRMSESEFIQKDLEHIQNVTEDDYYRIVRGKTSKLIEACAKSGAYLACASNEELDAIGNFSRGIGMAHQIIDDTLDIIGNFHNTGKNVGLDILEGKPTLPIIVAMNDSHYGSSVAEIFTKDNPTEVDVKNALDIIKKTSAVKICRKKASEEVENAIKSIGSIKDSPYKESLILLARYVASRDR